MVSRALNAKSLAIINVSIRNAINFAMSLAIENLVNNNAAKILIADIDALDFVERNVLQPADKRIAKIMINQLLKSFLAQRMTKMLNLFYSRIADTR